MKRIKELYKSCEKVMKLFNDYSKIASKAKYRSIYEEGLPADLATRLKILSSKKIFQRLPRTISQVKAGNTSEHLLHETCQIIYSLYQEKEITRKVYNNMLNSIKL